jgi:hypothetical protein
MHMGARELEMDQSAILGIEAMPWTAWREALKDEAAARATAPEPTLLEQYRKDPLGVRERIEREARQARSRMVGEWLSRIFA